MHIAQVCPNFYPRIGGLETQVMEISTRLVKRGFDLEILTTDPNGTNGKEVINNLVVRRFKSWAPNESYDFSMPLRAYLRKNESSYDLVHAYSYHSYPALCAARCGPAKRLVFSPVYHGRGHTAFRDLLHYPYKFIGRSIFERSDTVIVLSAFEKNLILANFDIDETKIVIMPNGVTKQEFEGLEKKKGKGLSLLSVCRLEEYKGVQHIIHALTKLEPTTVLSVVGKGPYKEKLISLVKDMNLIDRVTFYENLNRKELIRLYADADVFLLLSKFETFGLAVAEALAARTCCIVASTSALREWVDNVNCFGIEYPIDVEELAAIIEQIRGRQASNAKLRDWDEVAQHLQEAYESLPAR